MSSLKPADRVLVQLKQGGVLGVVDHFREGHPFYAFKGIPYAQPPVADLRFKDPVPLTKFSEDVVDCSEEGEASIHKDPYRAKMVGSEDCLYLNVYSPVKSGDVQKPLPVMVWIHGGAFSMDSGSENLYSPEYLIEKGVIVVTLNYRLGPLGFLSYPKLGIKGNMGLKDQLLALKWVNENIKHFGGDPMNICLFGESAGSASTHLHLLSSESRPYFQKAILQSGAALSQWVMQKEAELKATKLANLLKKGDKALETDKDIYDTLMSADPVEMYVNANKTLSEAERKRGLPIPFCPVVELPSEGAIITETPLELMRKMKVNYKPVMIGYTSNEGLIMLLDAVKKLRDYDKDFSRLVPENLNVKPGTPEMEEAVKLIRNYFFGDKAVDKDSLRQLGDLMSDYYFTMAIHWTVEMMARMEQMSPIFMYQFSYDGELNLPKRLFGLGKHEGACHGDDMFYLFKMKFMDLDVEEETDCFKVRDKMCRMWTNFAKDNNPTPRNDPELAGIQWDPVKQHVAGTFVPRALDIDKNMKMINPLTERMAFWRKLYDRFNKNFLTSKL